MRMWMVNTSYMCNKHLLGEHVECHMILRSAMKGKKLDGFVLSNCLEWFSLHKRHDDIANEMEFRGMNHKSPLSIEEFMACNEIISDYIKYSQVKRDLSEHMLFDRCPECLAKYEAEWRKQNAK